jgi:hypothetical protein
MSNPAGMVVASLGLERLPTRTRGYRFRDLRAAVACLAAALSLGWAGVTRAQLIPGIDEWAASTIESGKSKWAGQRVPFPDPSPRPHAQLTLRSYEWPLAVHVTKGSSLARAQATLRALEAAYALFAATGFSQSFGDGGQGGTADHDVYLMSALERGVDARIDATQPATDLDAARAFGLIDARVPMANLDACAAQALAEMLFFELDPAEAASVRKSSAAYLAFLATGRLGCDDDAERAMEAPHRAAMDTTPTAHGARWLSLLVGREDQHTGIFLREMWQFSRQHTWEGAGLRGSPDLFEAMAKAKELRKDTLEEVAAELSILSVLQLAEGPIGNGPSDPRHALLLADVAWRALPEHIAPASPPIEPLGSAYVLVRTQGAKPGERLRVWSRGELGVRWALTAAQLDAEGRVLSRVVIPTRNNPNGFLVVELEPRCEAVLVAATNVSDGIPDADSMRGDDLRSIAFMLDRGND